MPPQHHTDRRQRDIERVAHQLHQNRLLMQRPGDDQQDLSRAEKIVRNPCRHFLFHCHRPFIKLEKQLWEPIHTWAENQALLGLLGLIGNIGLIFAVVAYVGAEKQRRDSEVLTAWQTLTNAHGQPGNGGRIHALEFLNASPRNPDYDYPGANWRRRSICLWLCTWPSESLAGIDLSVELTDSRTNMKRVYLRNIQLPGAYLGSANLQGADLWNANFEGAYLRVANLEDAPLISANLRNADLGTANLRNADLESADLENAYLWYAKLEEARSLTQEQVSQAKLCKTQLPSHISLDPNRDCEELGVDPNAEE